MRMTPDQLDRMATSLRAGDYNLLLGAAASLGSTNADNTGLPLADELRLKLCALKKAKTTNTLQRIYQTLDEVEVYEHITKQYSGCIPGPTLRAITSFIWRRIFTLNVDDALEAAYSIGAPYQSPDVKNFNDPYEEVRERGSVPIIHLHGYAARPNDGYIFSREAYLKIIKTANPWMVVFSQLMASEPCLIIGSSLDEVDLDYFLSLRTPSSARADRGPSVLVEPFGDVVTDKECERLDLVRFHGTGDEFVKFLDDNVRQRPRPQDLVSADARSIFVGDPTTKDLGSFYSDFEKVPASIAVDTHDARFFFGHIPSWSDLSLRYDVGRPTTADIYREVARTFSGAATERLLLLSDSVGVGKSTTIRRVGFDFAREGTIVLSCSASSRLEPRSTADMLNKVVGRCLVLVDDFADQVYSIEAILELTNKPDLVFLGAERSYRYRFVREVLSGHHLEVIRMSPLSSTEVERLISTYFQTGLVGSTSFMEHRSDAIETLKGEPIAVACCRILNDLRPLDRIVESIVAAATSTERRRYLTAALAHYCAKSGIRSELLIAATTSAAITRQFSETSPLPLTYSRDQTGNYVVPVNATLAQRTLEIFASSKQKELLDTFVRLAIAIAPRVNRRTIVQRTPEARLAARLFDFDQVVQQFLGDSARGFYDEVQAHWQWNSRYWEQLALLNLYRHQALDPAHPDARASLDLAVAHARHAVSIEHHPLTLTTLAKILLSDAAARPGLAADRVTEAINKLNDAILIEQRRGRVTIQPFIVMFRGVQNLLQGTYLSTLDASAVRGHLRFAKQRFPNDAEMKKAIAGAEERLTNLR